MCNFEKDTAGLRSVNLIRRGGVDDSVLTHAKVITALSKPSSSSEVRVHELYMLA